jgi:hypothetical protein
MGFFSQTPYEVVITEPVQIPVPVEQIVHKAVCAYVHLCR